MPAPPSCRLDWTPGRPTSRSWRRSCSDKFAELPDNAREVVDYAMDECVRAHQDEFDTVLGVLPDIELAINQLWETVEETSVDVGQEGYGAIEKNGNTLEGALTRTATALDRVKALLAGYTF